MGDLRSRREPPQFRQLQVARVTERSPRLARITLAGPELAGFEPGLPAASVRLLLPPTGTDRVVIPIWNGNEFLFEWGTRPVIRTLTPLRFDPASNELDLEIVRHGEGPLASWAERARPGDPCAISGPGRGYEVDPAATTFLLAGDESALPAITQLIPLLPAGATVQVLVEIQDPTARLELPTRSDMTVRWIDRPVGSREGDALAEAVLGAELDPAVRVWAAGEAAAMQRIRRHLFDQVGLTRARCVIRGYWKHGRDGTGTD